MLKAALAGLVLSISGFANAILIIDHEIDVTYDGITANHSYTGDGNLEQGGMLQLSFEADTFDYWNNMASDFWSAILVSENATRIGDYSWTYSLDGLSVSMGSLLGNNSASVHIINDVGFYAGMFDKLVINYTLNTSTSADLNPLDGNPFTFWNPLPFSADYVQGLDPKDVPEPSTLAIFALGILGLASRKFKKQ